MTTTMRRSRSNDQDKIKIVCDSICDRIEELLDLLEIEYKNQGKMISMSCPIHGGDNASAVNIYPDGESYRGNWVCRTHGCEKTFRSSVLGFIRGILSHKHHGWSAPGDKVCSFKEALDFALEFTQQNLADIKIPKGEKEKRIFTNVVSYVNPINNSQKPSQHTVTRDKIRQSLIIPAEYYIERQYTKEVLDKYDVGLCNNPDKEMCNRVVVPIYDTTYKYMVGCSGRSIFDKCDLCGSYHNPDAQCPHTDQRWLYPKWKHNKDFKSQNHLYNFWFAKDFILQSSYAIIVESPGNVWRLEENGIHNAVAIFGASLSDRQKILLDSSGAMSLIILTDNDKAGDEAAKQIMSKCEHTYRVFRPQISKNDVGDMTSSEIKEQIIDFIARKI